MNLSGDVTLAVWVKTDSTAAPNTHRLIFGDSGPGVARNLHLSLDSYNRLSFEWADGKSNDSLLAPGQSAQRHVEACGGGGRFAGHAGHDVCGRVEVVRKAMSLPISKAPAKERLTGWFYNGFFQGELDDIRLYHRALTAEEIQRLFASQADVQAGAPTVLFDGSRSEPRGIVSADVPQLEQGTAAARIGRAGDAEARIDAGAGRGGRGDVGRGRAPARVAHRSDLFLCEPKENGTGPGRDPQRRCWSSKLTLSLATQSMLEPMRVQVKDPVAAEDGAGEDRAAGGGRATRHARRTVARGNAASPARLARNRAGGVGAADQIAPEPAVADARCPRAAVGRL